MRVGRRSSPSTMDLSSVQPRAETLSTKTTIDRCLQFSGGYGYIMEYRARLYGRASHQDLWRHKRNHEGDHQPFVIIQLAAASKPRGPFRYSGSPVMSRAWSGASSKWLSMKTRTTDCANHPEPGRQGQYQGCGPCHRSRPVARTRPTATNEIKVVILKANGKGFCGGHVARWGPDEDPYPDFGNTFEELYKGTADLFLWPTLYLWEFPKPTISQIHGYCMGVGIDLGLLTDFCVASEDAYFQMPLAQSLGEPGGHTMIEPWLMMNWHRTMDWLLLAPTLSAQQALDWGLLNRVVPREDLEDTVEEMARKIAQIPLTTLMAVKNNVKRAWELMGMRVHLQVSHILTNMVGAASDVQARRAELMQSGMKPREFVDKSKGEQT